MSTRHVGVWRITPIFRPDRTCAGVTLLTESGLHLDQAVWDALPVWEIVAQGPPPERLAIAAEVYKEADEAGIPRAKAVAAELGIGEASASNLIVQVRKALLLPATRPGVSAA